MIDGRDQSGLGEGLRRICAPTKGREQAAWEERRTAGVRRGEGLNAWADGKCDLCNRRFSRALALESDANRLEEGGTIESEIAVEV